MNVFMADPAGFWEFVPDSDCIETKSCHTSFTTELRYRVKVTN